MSDRPVFIYAAIYSDRSAAVADYELLVDLHAAALVGTYDAAVISKDDEGKVHVEKHEKARQHGGWGGAGVGAVVGLIFPPTVIAGAVVGGLAGAIGGHLKNAFSKGEAKELGEALEEGQAAIVVVGQSRVEEQLNKVLERAARTVEKELDEADAAELERAADENA